MNNCVSNKPKSSMILAWDSRKTMWKTIFLSKKEQLKYERKEKLNKLNEL